MERIEQTYSLDKAEHEASAITKKLNKEYPDSDGNFLANQYEGVSQEITERQIKLIQDLSASDTPIYLFGGYACELLLLEENGKFDGTFLDAHTDIDMVLKREDQPKLQDRLRELNLKFKSKGRKLFLSDSDGLQADFALLDEDSVTGELSISGSSENDSKKVYFKPDFLGETTILLNGKPIRVVSPSALIQSLIFYAEGDLSHLREKDRIRAERLCLKYFPLESLDSPMFKTRME